MNGRAALMLGARRHAHAFYHYRGVVLRLQRNGLHPPATVNLSAGCPSSTNSETYDGLSHDHAKYAFKPPASSLTLTISLMPDT